jgi:uncharacterized membrane protein
MTRAARATSVGGVRTTPETPTTTHIDQEVIMSEHNVIAAGFTESSKAFEALSRLKVAGFEGRVGVRSAVLVERDADGRVRIPDGVDETGGTATWGGGLIGLTIGILGGPIGMLFGWTTGMLVGGAFDIKRTAQGSDILSELSRTVPPGGTAVVAELDEYATEVVDTTMAELDGVVVRRSAAEVLAELEAAEDAYEEARRAGEKAARAERRAERKESFEQRRDALKVKLGID